MSILKSYALHWYHTYILHPVIDRTEAPIFQHFYWTIIINSVRKEVKYFDTCQRTKRSFIQEWIEGGQLFAKICTGTELETAFKRK